MQRLYGYARQLTAPGVPIAVPTVTVYHAGTLDLADIYEDNLAAPTPKGNPFTGDVYGFWYFYATARGYDVRVSGGTPPLLAYTLGDLALPRGGGSYVSIGDFNAIGNGTDDTSQAFWDAYDQLPASGGTIFVPWIDDGYFLISEFPITKPIRLLGECRFEASTGLGEGVIIKTTTNTPLLTFGIGSSQSSLEHIACRGNGSGAANNQDLLTISCGGPVNLFNVQLRAAGGKGAKVTYMIQANWHQVKIDGSRGIGLDFDKGASPAAIGQNLISSLAVDSAANGNPNIRLAGCQQTTFVVASSFNGSGTGWSFELSTAEAVASKDNNLISGHCEQNVGSDVIFNNGSQRNRMSFDSYTQAITDNSGAGSGNEVWGPLVVGGVTGYGGPSAGLGYNLTQSMKETTNSRVWSRNLDDTKGSESFATLERIRHTAGASAGMVINEDGNDLDFRIESDTVANAFAIDGATGRVTMGGLPTSNPGGSGLLWSDGGTVKIT